MSDTLENSVQEHFVLGLHLTQMGPEMWSGSISKTCFYHQGKTDYIVLPFICWRVQKPQPLTSPDVLRSLNQNQRPVKQTDKVFPHLARLIILLGFDCCLQCGVGNGNNGRGNVFHQTSVISSSASSPSVSPSASPSSSSSSSDVTSSSSVWETHLMQEHTNR